VLDDPVAKSVTSWPFATRPSVKRAVTASTDPERVGGID
jgi:hypothetical protein